MNPGRLLSVAFEFIKSLKWYAWLFIFLALVLLGILDGQVTEALEATLHSSKGTNTFVLIGLGLVSMALSLFFPALMTCIAFTFHSWPAPAKAGALLRQGIIEMMRAWGQIFIRLLCLILPGLWRMAETVYVPIVVGHSFSYHSGRLDAPDTSARIFRQTWLRSLLAILIFYIVLPFVSSSYFSDYKNITEQPLGFALLTASDTFFFVLGTAVLVSIAKTAPAMQAVYQKVSSIELSAEGTR